MKLRKLIISNFRGIRNQEINDIQDALVLIGKNNAGKSAILTAIRALRGDYSISDKDFHKDSREIKITASFELNDSDFDSIFSHPKFGFTKYPSTSADFEEVKSETIWEDKGFKEFDKERKAVNSSGLSEDMQTILDYKPIWNKAIIQSRFVENNMITLEMVCERDRMKTSYSNKDILSILPEIAFIDDTRNFEEEESGKTRSITASLFNQLINTELLGETVGKRCENCTSNACFEECIDVIQAKSVESLTIEELQKLVNYKTKNSAFAITSKISERFKENYRSEFGVNIRATSSFNKSFSFATKLYDPALESELDLSNVGAGVRSIYILSLLQAYQDIKAEDQNTIFVIEEPELYLHPELQKSMAKTLFEISNNSQVFFTTHSPIMLREFQSNDIRQVHLDEVEYNTEVKSTTIDAILNEIGYASQDILNTDFVLFVEGKTDKEFFYYLIKKYYEINMDRLTIIDTGSCSNIKYYATLRFLGKTTMSKDIAIVHDSDTSEKATVINKLKNGIVTNLSEDYFESIADRIYITQYSSIEGYLFSPELLVEHSMETGYQSTDEVNTKLKNSLEAHKNEAINYFRSHNSNNPDRVDIFIRELSQELDADSLNLEWVKCNLRGHNYFDITNSKRISTREYVEKKSRESFADVLDFFDGIDFFRERKR